MSPLEPTFPAIKVHRDGSLGLLLSIDYWRGDVDQWYWGDEGDYLIDSRGTKFEQEGTWLDKRPIDVPRWKYSTELPYSALFEIAATSPDPKLELSDLSARTTVNSLVTYLHTRLSNEL